MTDLITTDVLAQLYKQWLRQHEFLEDEIPEYDSLSADELLCEIRFHIPQFSGKLEVLTWLIWFTELWTEVQHLEMARPVSEWSKRHQR